MGLRQTIRDTRIIANKFISQGYTYDQARTYFIENPVGGKAHATMRVFDAEFPRSRFAQQNNVIAHTTAQQEEEQQKQQNEQEQKQQQDQHTQEQQQQGDIKTVITHHARCVHPEHPILDLTETVPNIDWCITHKECETGDIAGKVCPDMTCIDSELSCDSF